MKINRVMPVYKPVLNSNKKKSTQERVEEVKQIKQTKGVDYKC